MKNRMISQDIAKGLATIVVLWFHCTINLTSFSAYFLLPFAWVMAFFFIISGYNYHKGKRTILENILLRIKQLLIPLLIYSIVAFIFMLCVSIPYGFSFKSNVLGLLNNFFLSPTLEALKINTLFGIEDLYMGIPSYTFSWFIWYMLFGYCLFYLIVDYTTEKASRFYPTIIGLLGISTLIIWLLKDCIIPFNIHYAPFVTTFLLTGSYMSKKKIFDKGTISNTLTIIISLVLCIICCTMYLLFDGIGIFAGGWAISDYGVIEVPVTYLLGTACVFYFINLCRLLEKVKFIVKPLTFIGEHSMGVYILQFGVLDALNYVFGINSNMKGNESKFWEVLVGFSVTLIICLVASYFIDKLLFILLSGKKKKVEEVK